MYFLFIAARIFLCTLKWLTRERMSVFGCAIYCRHLHLCTFYTCAHFWMYHWLNMRLHGAALAVTQSSCSLPSVRFLEAERRTGFPAAALSAWPAFKSHHHQRKRALKCLLLLSSGILFTSLWNPHSPHPDNSSRCLDGIQIAAYSLHSVRMAKS